MISKNFDMDKDNFGVKINNQVKSLGSCATTSEEVEFIGINDITGNKNIKVDWSLFLK